MKFIHLVPSTVVLLQAGVLALGMASWLGDEDDEEGGDAGDGASDDFDMDDDFDDFDEEFGGLDDMDDGGGGAADQSITELENRIEQLETEVANVSSKANTVRSENEQISESVDDVEENVRKLLEIYEMVTRGVNPFVDDVQPGGGMEGGMGDGSNSFGLFDDDGGEDEEDEALDDDIASAEAEDFFDDDALDDFEEDAEADVDDTAMAAADGETDASAADGGSSTESGGGGTSFEELKAEYESGDADWADEDIEEHGAEEQEDLGFDEEDADLEGDADVAADADAADDPEDLFFEDDVDETDEDADDAAVAESEFEPDPEPEYEVESEPEQEPEQEPEPDPEPEPASIGRSSPSAGGLLSGSSGDGPHLQTPPTGYLADVVVLEWLTTLLDDFGPRNTVRTLNYYERIGWISEDVKDHLFEFLEGLSDSDHVYRQEMGTTELTMDDHLQSLEYIEELADGDLERGIIERCEDLHADGIQR